VDVVLVNGILHEGDQIVVCGMQVTSLFKLLSVIFGISLSYVLIFFLFFYTGTYYYHHKSSVDTSPDEGA
jgi:hypothetical protein